MECFNVETALILAVGEHGQLSATLNQQMKRLGLLEVECETACKQAVGFSGVKTATELINSAQVILVVLRDRSHHTVSFPCILRPVTNVIVPSVTIW